MPLLKDCQLLRPASIKFYLDSIFDLFFRPIQKKQFLLMS